MYASLESNGYTFVDCYNKNNDESRNSKYVMTADVECDLHSVSQLIVTENKSQIINRTKRIKPLSTNI